MIVGAHSRAQYHVIAKRRASRQAGLRHQNAVTPDDHIVADLHLVVDLGALPDHGVAARSTVDRGIGADLHVVLDDDPADLGHLLVPLRARQVAEAILPDAAPRMHDDLVTEKRVRERRAGADRAAAADANVSADHRSRADHAPAADLGTRADDRGRIDRGAALQPRRSMHEGTGRNRPGGKQRRGAQGVRKQ